MHMVVRQVREYEDLLYFKKYKSAGEKKQIEQMLKLL